MSAEQTNKQPPSREFSVNNTAVLGLITSILAFLVSSQVKNPNVASLLADTGYTAGLLTYVGTVGKAVWGIPQWKSTIKF